MILDDVIGALEAGRSPILLTERRDHLDYFAGQLGSVARHLVVLRGGMGVRQRREVADQLGGIPDDEERLVLATGRFIGEGFDDARLDTLFLAMPISWKGTLVQYAGRLHRQHAIKSQVRIFDYVDGEVSMLARMVREAPQVVTGPWDTNSIARRGRTVHEASITSSSTTRKCSEIWTLSRSEHQAGDSLFSRESRFRGKLWLLQRVEESASRKVSWKALIEEATVDAYWRRRASDKLLHRSRRAPCSAVRRSRTRCGGHGREA